jgi:hypothetical protein
MTDLDPAPTDPFTKFGALLREPLQLAPQAPTTFDYSLFQWVAEQQARIEALYGPRLQRISGCAPLVHWLMRQFPQADPGVTPVTLLGTVALTVDEDVPIDSLRLTYADGSHKDVCVIEPPAEGHRD